jgi:hypothetical protein
LDNMGKMICFDFNGNYIKTLKLDYMTRQMIPLPTKKIAVVGWVIWSTKIRDFVALVDYETNKQKVIWEHLTNRNDTVGHSSLFNYGYEFKEHGAISFNTMPYSSDNGMSSPPQISCIGNNLVIAIPTIGEILVYDLEGKLISKDKVEWSTNSISVKEQKVIQQRAIDYYKSIKNPNFANWVTPEENKLALETIIKDMEADLDKISDPITFPAFSTIIKDSDGNLLFFDLPPDGNSNKFNVWIYENTGKFVCQSSFVCDEYNLIIKSSIMVFHNGYIYSLQRIENTQGVPLRLVRFKLTSD